jgi:hypothetical protein
VQRAWRGERTSSCRRSRRLVDDETVATWNRDENADRRVRCSEPRDACTRVVRGIGSGLCRSNRSLAFDVSFFTPVGVSRAGVMAPSHQPKMAFRALTRSCGSCESPRPSRRLTGQVEGDAHNECASRMPSLASPRYYPCEKARRYASVGRAVSVWCGSAREWDEAFLSEAGKPFSPWGNRFSLFLKLEPANTHRDIGRDDRSSPRASRYLIPWRTR